MTCSCGKVTLVYLLSSCVLRLVFSQSLISLDLIEDFLELSCRAKDEDKISPYKGKMFSLVQSDRASFIEEVLTALGPHVCQCLHLTSLNDPTVAYDQLPS